MADIMCTVPDCDAQATLVLNGYPSAVLIAKNSRNERAGSTHPRVMS